MSRVKGDRVDGDTAMEDRRGSGIKSALSMPRYPYRSASARVSARLADEADGFDMLALKNKRHFSHGNNKC